MTDNWPLGQVQHRDRKGLDFHAEMRYEGFLGGGGNTAHIPGSCYQKDVQNNQSSH